MIPVEMPLVQSMASVAPAVPLPGGTMTLAVGLILLGFAVNTIGSCCRLVDFTLMMWRVCRRGGSCSSPLESHRTRGDQEQDGAVADNLHLAECRSPVQAAARVAAWMLGGLISHEGGL
jgi:hypothetical protein